MMGLLLLSGSFPAYADVPSIFQFDSRHGSSPLAALAQGPDGNYYGTTATGGAGTAYPNGNGTVYKVTPGGSVTILASFTDGSVPFGTLVLGADGSFYGTTEQGGSGDRGTVYKLTTDGTPAETSLTTLYNFDGGSNGGTPFSTLSQAADGSFYGTTSNGGSDGKGTIFRLTTDGTPAGTFLTTLLNFNGSNGAFAEGALTYGPDGNYYGVTQRGGSSDNGTIFKLATDGTPPGTTLITLVNFNGSNGINPFSAPILAHDGSFYGTTYAGGVSNAGTLYKLSTDGTTAGSTLTTLFNFNNANGVQPTAPLIQGSDGNFYGSTTTGGPRSYGTAFRLITDGTAAGSVVTSLVNFNGSNGSQPSAALIQAGDGSFYGTAYGGGNFPTGGTVYRVSAPTVSSGALAIPKDQAVRLSLTYSDTNGEQGYQTLNVGSPLHGTLSGRTVSYDSVHGTGVINETYTPNAGFTGTDSFTFSVANAFGSSSTAAYNITVTGAPGLQSLVIDPGMIVGGSSTAGVVALTSSSASPATVALTSSDPYTLSVRPSVTITAGHRHANFMAASRAVSTSTDVIVTATCNGVTTTQIVTVTPPPSALLSVQVSPTSVVGGSANAAGTAALQSATSYPVTATLTSSNPAALSVPSSVTIGPTHRTAPFTAVSHPVTAAQTVTITAVANGVTKTCTVTVTP